MPDEPTVTDVEISPEVTTTVTEPAPEYPKIIGHDARSMPHPGGRVDFHVVLVQWDETHVHAYRGIGPKEFVRDRGDPLSMEEAKPHFPGIEFDIEQRKLVYGEL